MQVFTVNGMSCAACASAVERAVSALDGVESCAVSLLTESMSVNGSATDEAIVFAVEKAGYKAAVKGESTDNTQNAKAADKDETSSVIKRLLFSVFFLALLLYISMGHNMLSLPLPSFLETNAAANGLTQLLLCACVLVINQKFFISGTRAFLRFAPNMDSLVMLGSGAAFVYSTAALYVAVATGEKQEFYFESAAMILTLITVGKLLEAFSKGKTASALKELVMLAPKTANVIRDGKEITIPAKDVIKGDVFTVRSGESVPVDGIIIEGEGSFDQSALTGESIPADKAQNDEISAATVCSFGFVKCEALRVGEDTMLSQIIKTVSEAQSSKAPIARVADRVSAVFVPVVLVIALLTAVIWFICGQTAGFALARGISVLVISCPCALGLATPVAIMAGSGVGARRGILFRNAAALETAGRIKTVALDKTGTVTKGSPSVTDIIPNGITSNELLFLAAALEKKSEHPLAKAILSKAEEDSLFLPETSEFKVVSGSGILAKIENRTLFGGNADFIGKKAVIPSHVTDLAQGLADEGKTPLFFADDNSFLGIIAVADTIKDDSAFAVGELKKMGLRVVMLTGDNQRTATAIAKKSGIDEVIADVLPQKKAEVIEKLCKTSACAMVGDGINDAPALTKANLGIAMGAGTDIAIDSADTVLMNSSVNSVFEALKIGRATLKNIRENLFWAFFYNCIGIPLAAGVLIPISGLYLSPMIAAAAMSLSSFCVVSNALRLNLLFRRKKVMEKTLKIEGMMCAHCEAHVKKALESVPQVESVEASFKNGTAKVKANGDIPDEVLKKAVTDAGYKVI